MPFGSYLIRRENGINMQGGMFFDEMRGQYVNIPIVKFMGDQALSANGVLYEVEMTPEEQIAMMKAMSMQR